MDHEYIKPITKVYSNFAEARESVGHPTFATLFHDDKTPDIPDLAQGRRNLIVGEPGVGKSLLMHRIDDHLRGQGVSTKFIDLRRVNALRDVLSDVSTEKLPGAFILDGLDEVKASAFPDVLEKLVEISANYADLTIYLSSRWVFISRFANSFPEYRFIVVSPFTQSQVREYLLASGHSEREIDVLVDRITPFSQRPLVIQIPRYLAYLDSFVKERGIDAISGVSRAELFDYFIYAKLELEEKKQLSEDRRAMTKRVLEKLALAMEIYQTNVITKDELMTFFDELNSDLKLVALTQINIETFYDYSLLRVGSDVSLDEIEFENAEFQEYLAAKEIARFSDPSLTAFAFAVDSTVGEIYPTWYNTLAFLVEMAPPLLEQLVEFSGLRAGRFRVIDESFLAFLGRVDLRKIDPELRRTLFVDVMEYHCRTSQWLSGDTAIMISLFFDATLESYLVDLETRSKDELGDKRIVHVGNLIFVIAYLLKRNAPLDWGYWRGKLLDYASSPCDSGVLQRYALLALQFSKDTTVIASLPNAIDGDQLVQEALLTALVELGPNEPRSVDQFIAAVRRGDAHGRYGLLAITTREALGAFLKAFIDDTQFRSEFLEESSVFGDKDHVITEHIAGVLDDEIRELCKEVIFSASHHNVAHNAERSPFIIELWKLLKADDASFIAAMLERVEADPDNRGAIYFVGEILARILVREDVQSYLEFMKERGSANSAFGVMVRIKLSNRPDADDVFESGRPYLSEEYRHWEGLRAASDGRQDDHVGKKLQQFRRLLEPEPGMWDQGVFEFFNRNSADILPRIEDKERARLIDLLTNALRWIDPSTHELTFTQENAGARSFTTSSNTFLFKEAIQAADEIGMDLAPYRQQLINFIPFAYSDELKIIFTVVSNMTANELDGVLKTYRNRESDLWRYNPRSFIHAVEQYHVVGAVPTVRALILDPAWDLSARTEALPVVDSLMPDAEFLRRVFAESMRASASSEDRRLAYVANGLLIVSHRDEEALRWRLREIIARAVPLKRDTGDAHAIDEIGSEVLIEREFAAPLRSVKDPGFEEDYLELLSRSMDVWAKGEAFHEYASYLWEIVYAYFDNLKVLRSYLPLQRLEAKIADVEECEGSNWLAARMLNLRRSYLSYVGKPENISSAVATYNGARHHDPKRIQNSVDLFEQVRIALEDDLRRWIEGEGAYEVLRHKVSESGRQSYETLIQKTAKTQIENALLRRGYRAEIVREPQLLDDKRPDILVYHGFVGPVVVEVKLTSNSEIKGKNVKQKRSYANMKRYMEGYGARRGILMVFDNDNATNLPHVTEAFESIPGVRVVTFDCAGPEPKKLPRKSPNAN